MCEFLRASAFRELLGWLNHRGRRRRAGMRVGAEIRCRPDCDTVIVPMFSCLER
jgi:hypothetical protein